LPTATWVLLANAYPSIIVVFHFHAISMDFITNLPPFHSFNSILVVVDRLTKMIHFIPCNKIIIGKKRVKLFFDHVFQYHDLPKDIIFDHGPQFASKFWR
jgi:hypothetical protein